MRTIFRAARCILAPCVLAAAFAGCGASQVPPALPIPADVNAAVSGAKKSAGLIYAATRQVVEVYSYPDGTMEQRFHVSGSVNGACADAKGDVFLAAAPKKSAKGESGFVYEFAHGGKVPIATLNLPKPDEGIACSSDPVTGDLAVTVQNVNNYAPSILIYPKAGGTPKRYQSDALGADPQAGYDDNGDLLATSGSNVGAELLKGKTSLITIKLNTTLGPVGHVQWDGTYWALQSFDVNHHNGERLFERIYRFQISGSSGRFVSYSQFDDWGQSKPGQSWIQGSTILATPYSEIIFWDYPQGGKPTKVIRSPQPVKAITISIAG
jgi:hypothetical protein